MAVKGVGRLGRLSRSLALGAGVATMRFPLAALLIVTMSILANLALSGIYPVAEERLPWLLAALYGASAASVGVRLFSESHGSGGTAQVAGPVIAGAAIGLVIWNAEALSVYAPIIVVAVTLGIPLAPYIGRPDDQKFWSFALWTTVGVTLAFVSVLFFVLGVSAILEMIRFLFEIGLTSTAYEHIYTTALTLVGPLVALGRIPTGYDETVPVAADDRMAAGVRFLFDWVAIPLTFATALVLHLYAGKVVFLTELPKNEVGSIVTFYAVLVLSLRVAADPFIRDGARSTRLFGTLWAPMLVIPIALLMYAASLRIGAEGFTVERYYLALGAVAATLVVAAQLIPRQRGDIRLICAIPLALLTLSSFGPWSVQAVVARSQLALLRAVLVDPATPGGAPDVAGMDASRRAMIRSRIYALDEVDALGRAAQMLPEDRRGTLAGRENVGADEMLSMLGLDYDAVAPAGLLSVTTSGEAVVDLAGYDIGIIDRFVQSGGVNATGVTDAALYLEGSDLVVSFRGVVDRFSMTAAIASIPPGNFTDGASSIAPLVFDLSSANGRRLRLRTRQITVDASTKAPMNGTVAAFLRSADWPPAATRSP